MLSVRNIGDMSRLETWLEHTVHPRLTLDHSNYAKNRPRAWLRVEPPLGKGPFRPGIEVPDAVWERLQQLIDWQFDYCLVTWSGPSSVGITPHRDASYADYEACGLNVSGTAKFEYWNDRRAFGYAPSSGKAPFPGPPSETVQLTPGDLVRFNCKNLHSSQPSPNRWNMNFWKAK